MGVFCPAVIMLSSEKYNTVAADSPPDSAVSDCEVDLKEAVSMVLPVDDGVEVMPTRDYGVGIDCHSRFLEINVLVKRGPSFFEYCREVSTDWNAIKSAHEWVIHVLRTCSDPPVMLSSPLHYCIESTSTYHLPVLLAWEGTPSVVNPSIAGATKKKTDKLDARLLAVHDLTGIWRPFYVVPENVQDLRVLIGQRDYYSRLASAIGNRINSTILKFGFTVGKDGSVVKNTEVRAIVENLICDHPEPVSTDLPQRNIPEDTRHVLSEEYQLYDRFSLCVTDFDKQIRDKVCSMDWPVSGGKTVSGKKLLSILMTAPGIGERTAITWLAKK